MASDPKHAELKAGLAKYFPAKNAPDLPHGRGGGGEGEDEGGKGQNKGKGKGKNK